jgi:hypothetical protein
MSTFSLPPNSLDDSINDAMIIAGGAGIDTITLNTTSSNYYFTGAGIGGSGNTITISNGGTGSSGFTIGGAGNTVILDNISTTSFNWINEEFVNCMPDYNRIQKMCKEYPGLAIAYEKFKTVYSLVKDHYDTPEDKRPKP